MEITYRRVENPYGESKTIGGRSGRRKTVTLPRYEVRLDGEVIGYVSRAIVTRETRSAGRVYVNSRWDSVAWVADAPGGRWSRLDYDTRWRAISEVVQAHTGLPWHQAEVPARSATEVR